MKATFFYGPFQASWEISEARPGMRLAKPMGDVSASGRPETAVIRDIISKQLRFRLVGVGKDGAVYHFVEEI